MSNWANIEAIAQRQGFKHYNDYLESNHWRFLRKSKLDETYSCCVCCASGPLAVHHINYRELLDVLLTDLEVLCMECHDVFHMACRRKGLDYIGKGKQEIIQIVTDFRASPWCKKWLGKRVKKRPVLKKNSTPKSALKKAFRYCRSRNYSVQSLERLKAVCDLLIAKP